MAKLAGSDDLGRIQGELEMASRLQEAVQTGPTPIPQAKSRKRAEKDPKLIERMVAAANSSNNVKSVDEGGANYKITGKNGNRLYVFKNQLRVDLSGFSFEHPGIRVISDEEAKNMHLGKVRGQVSFDDKSIAYDAFEKALERLA